MISASQALEQLREGNRRFVASVQRGEGVRRYPPLEELTQGQAPFAVILGCSDSRVPAELVFSQGLGDLFVVRVAGNIVAPTQIGSIEFAAERFGTRLVVVLGHSNCGAVDATLQALRQPGADPSPNLGTIVERIAPAVRDLAHAAAGDEAQLMQDAVRANVRASVAGLREQSAIIDHLVQTDGLMVVGAEYALGTGRVEFLDV